MKALYNCRGCREKASVLAIILGVAGGHPVLNLQIFRLGKRIINRLPNVKFPLSKSGSIQYWHIPFWAEDADKKGQYIWELRPELKEAVGKLLTMGEFIPNTMMPEEISEEESKSLFEGAKRQITVNDYERNPQARKVCIEYYGVSCQICGFDFGKFYGNQFEGIIRVLHKKPISELKDNYQINPKKDLIPVCPNCHSAVHSRILPYRSEELKCMINKDQEREITVKSWKNNKDVFAYYETLQHGIIGFYIICAGNFESFDGNEFVKYIMDKEFNKDIYHSYTGDHGFIDSDYRCNIEIYQNGECRYVIRNKNNELKEGTIQLL